MKRSLRSRLAVGFALALTLVMAAPVAATAAPPTVTSEVTSEEFTAAVDAYSASIDTDATNTDVEFVMESEGEYDGLTITTLACYKQNYSAFHWEWPWCYNWIGYPNWTAPPGCYYIATRTVC